jgi:hypothetical protein
MTDFEYQIAKLGEIIPYSILLGSKRILGVIHVAYEEMKGENGLTHNMEHCVCVHAHVCWAQHVHPLVKRHLISYSLV